jgi:hypothetical protein
MPVAEALFLDKKTGKRVKLCGGTNPKEPFVMVMGADNKPYYCEASQLVTVDSKGTPNFNAPLEVPLEEKDEKPPAPIIPIAETRLNLNLASPAEISARVPGVGYRTAKKIVDHRLSLPGEKFSNLDQVREVSSRVNWEAVLEADVLFVG